MTINRKQILYCASQNDFTRMPSHICSCKLFYHHVTERWPENVCWNFNLTEIIHLAGNDGANNKKRIQELILWALHELWHVHMCWNVQILDVRCYFKGSLLLNGMKISIFSTFRLYHVKTKWEKENRCSYKVVAKVHICFLSYSFLFLENTVMMSSIIFHSKSISFLALFI